MLANIRSNLQNLAVQIPERIQTFESEARQPLTFGNFVRYLDYEPEVLLRQVSWSGWKARSGMQPAPTDPDLAPLRAALVRAASVNGPQELGRLRGVKSHLISGNVDGALADAENLRKREGVYDSALRPGREGAQQHDGPLHLPRPRRPRASRKRAPDQGHLAPPAANARGDVRDESQREMSAGSAEPRVWSRGRVV